MIEIIRVKPTQRKRKILHEFSLQFNAGTANPISQRIVQYTIYSMGFRCRPTRVQLLILFSRLLYVCVGKSQNFELKALFGSPAFIVLIPFPVLRLYFISFLGSILR